MKIQWKIFYSLFTIVLFLFIVVALTYNAAAKVSYYRDRSQIVNGRLLSATYLRAQVRNQLLETFDVLYVSGITEHEDRITKGRIEVQNRVAEFEKTLTQSGVTESVYRTDFDELVNSYVELQKTLDQGVDLLKKGKAKQAQLKLIDARENKFEHGFLIKISEIINKETHISELESKNLEESINWLQRIVLLSAGAALVFSLFVSTYMARSIGRRLKSIEKAAQRISAHDFDISLPTNGSDEVSALSSAFNKMAASLKDAKNQIEKQQELLIISSKMSSLGEMATGIAHEINTPLAVIGLRASLLENICNSEDFAETGKQKIVESTAIIERTTNRIAKIISGLRAFARDGASDPFQNEDLKSIIEETLDLCGEKFRSHGVQLKVKIPENTIMLSCRSTQISQVILNLLQNSFDAVQALTEKWIELEALETDQHIEISVTDSGMGIAPAIRTKLTQPFFTTKDVGKGTGLGLSISRGIALDHRGSLYLDEKCRNTRFVLRLPKDHPQI